MTRKVLLNRSAVVSPSSCMRSAAAAAGLCAFVTLAALPARGQVVRGSPGTIEPRNDAEREAWLRRHDEIVKSHFKPKPFTGELARCRVCRKPLKDHNDPDLVCRSPDPRSREASLGTRDLRCPVCSQAFEAPIPDVDPKAEVDLDFCRHPRRTYAIASDVALCPKCGYAALLRGFDRPVDAATRKLLKEKITPATRHQMKKLIGFKPKDWEFKDFSFIPQASIPEHIKYENAVVIYRQRKADRRTMARLHLGASHSYRRLMNQPIAEIGLQKAIRRVEARLGDPATGQKGDILEQLLAARKMLARADAEKAPESARLSRREKYYLLVRMAGLHDRLGEPWWGRKRLRKARELGAQMTVLRKNLTGGMTREDREKELRAVYVGFVDRLAGMIEREVHHQRRAAENLRQALEAGEIPAAERLRAIYLVGELLARIAGEGGLERALSWLEAAERLASTGAAGGGSAERRTLQLWARFRLRSPIFFKTVGGKHVRIAADPEEKALVAKVAPGAGARPCAPATPAATASPQSTQGTPRKTGSEDASALSAPSAVKAVAAAVEDAASYETCREHMQAIWKAIDAYRHEHGGFPPDLGTLVESGHISRAEAGGFRCVDSGARLFYSCPKVGSGRAFILFHSKPSTCSCKNILYSDGTISRFGK